MIVMRRLLHSITCILFILILPSPLFAQQKIVNVYAWTGEIPDFIVHQFEKETGIKVNFSVYENNEIMYTKLRTMQTTGYDVVMPSSYFVDRMRKQNLLEKLDKTKLSNWKNIDPQFLNPAYDPGTQYSVPFIWGVTGIFVNRHAFDPDSVKKWSDLWQPRFKNKLMLLDDAREVFSMALISLGYSANDNDPAHIKAAFLKLKDLVKNIKVFSSETIVSIMIDEDATIGMGWNGDILKAAQENHAIKFIYPEDGFVIWVDNFSIPKNAPHKEEAYAFLNFMLRPDIASTIAIQTHFPIANLAGRKQLPPEIRNNPDSYPPKSIMQRGQFQTDLREDTLTLLEQYWEELKMGG